MDLKLPVILILLLGKLYRLVLNIVQYRSAGNPTPANVADVYDEETYRQWKRYSAEKCRMEIVSTVLSCALTLVMLLCGVYAAVADFFPVSHIWQLIAVVLAEALTSALVAVPLQYWDTMIIEQKYGFNRSKMKTFLADNLRSLLLEIGLGALIASLLYLLRNTLGIPMILIFAGAMFAFSLLISFLYPVLNRIGNKFVPLEEGELRSRLMQLLTSHGYQVKAIEVMDASRRTTKLNAYFAGFGKLKTIVLFDNLVNAMSPDEICAVFAHELGHGLHKDVLKRQIMNFGNMLLMGVTVWLSVRYPQIHEAFGFDGINYGFAYILLGLGLGLLNPLIGLVMNAYSRMAEFRADRQAVQEGYGPAMITALKKLAKENFAHLAPSRLNVVLEYSHPPLSQRIATVEEAMKQ